MRATRHRGRPTVRSAALGAAALSVALSAAAAFAAPGSLTFVDVEKDGVGGVDGLETAAGVASSPDGRHVYATGFKDDAVVVFSRDPATSALSFVELHRDALTGITGLDGAAGVLVSPDGRHVYVAGNGDDTVLVFARDATTGSLTFVEEHRDGVAGVNGLDGASGLAIAPDGGHLYVTGEFEDALTVFARNPVTGALTVLEEHRDGVAGVDGLDRPVADSASPDGRNLYVSSEDDDAVAVFSRDPATGGLSFLEQHRDGVGGVDGLDGAAGIAASADGRSVYSASRTDDAVVAFARDAGTGALSFLEQHKDGVGGTDGLDFAQGVAVSPDGANVYATGGGDNALVAFARDPVTSALSFVEQDKDGVDGVDGLGGANQVDATCDGGSVNATGATDHALVAFSREGGAPGTCAPDLELLASKQKIDKAVEATASCGNEICDVQVSGRLKGVGKKLNLKPDADQAGFGEDQPLELGLGRKARKRAKDAREDGKKVFAKLTANATDLAGNAATTETLKLKLK